MYETRDAAKMYADDTTGWDGNRRRVQAEGCPNVGDVTRLKLNDQVATRMPSEIGR